MTETVDFDSTMALLATDVPAIPNYPRPGIDSDEEEVFFGPQRSAKELYGKNASEYQRRETLQVSKKVERMSNATKVDKTIPEEDEDKENVNNGPSITPRKIFSGTTTKPTSEGKSSKRIEELQELEVVGDGDESRSSLVDLENDQIFDSSIFTEYNECDLSVMSERISKKWRTRLTKANDKKAKKQPQQTMTTTTTTTTSNKSSSNEIGMKKKIDETMYLLNDVDLSVKSSSDAEKDVSNGDLAKIKKNLNFDSICASVSCNNVTAEFNALLEEDAALTTDEVLDESTTSHRSRRRSSTNSTCSDWFNTTREEMILYEKYGPDYDLVVEKMSHEEKTKLKADIANSVPKDVRELLGDEVVSNVEVDEDEVDVDKAVAELDDIAEEEEEEHGDDDDADDGLVRIEETPDVSQLSDKRSGVPTIQTRPNVPPIPLPRTLTPQKVREEAAAASTEDVISTPRSKPDFALPSSVSKIPSSSEKRTPLGGGARKKYFKTPDHMKTPSYLKPTTASVQRSSPRKPVDPSSPSGACLRGHYCGASPFMQPSVPPLPSSSAAAELHQRTRTPIDMGKIVSPVAQYIHNSNVPKLLRNIRAKAIHNLEDEILAMEKYDEKVRANSDNNTVEDAQPKRRYFKPLPEAEYRSSRVALEKEVPTDELKDLPKKFMVASSTAATVVRHLSRDRIAQQDVEKLTSSPDKGLVVMRSTAPVRESDVFNETSMEMSIREVKQIKKLRPNMAGKILY